MSKYSEIREVLKEDIHELVEKELFSRMTNIIPALMPAVLEFVADSMKVYTAYNSKNTLIRDLVLEYVDPVTKIYYRKPIKSEIILDAHIVNNQLDELVRRCNSLESRIITLESQKAASRNTDTGFF